MTESLAPTDEVITASADVNSEVYTRLLRLEELRSQAELLVQEVKVLTMELEAMVPRTATYRDDAGVDWRATVVRPDDTVLVDLDTVLRMRPELYHRITTVSLDRKALNKALRAGAVDLEVAEAAMTLRPNSPSVRLTRIDEPDPEPAEEP